MALLRPLLRNETGGAAAEMALLVPLLTVILFASLEGGHFLWSEHKLLKGVRDGARFAGRQSFLDVDCASNAFADSAVTDAVVAVTRTGFIDGDNPSVTGSDNPVISGWAEDQVTVAVECDDTLTTGIYRELSSGAPRVTVSASVDYPSLFGAVGFDALNLTLNGEAQAAVMGL